MSEPVYMDITPAAYLNQLFSDMEFAHTIFTATKLGIADLLKDGPLSIADIAVATGTHSGSLYRMLRALAGRGIFSEDAGGRFSLTALAEPLRGDAPDSVRNWVLYAGSEVNHRTWANLSYSMRTGQSAFVHLYGKSWFDYLDEQPEMAKVFNDLMTSLSTFEGAAIVSGHDFSGYRKIVDVGGGHGAFLACILEKNTHSSGVLFDAPQVIAGAAGAIDEYVAQGRAEKVSGNFFEAVPGGGDAYVLKSILHDWDDDRAIGLLKNCRQAMAENGRVLIVEIVIPAGNVPSPGKMVDLRMLLMVDGHERTEEEIRDLLRQAGLELIGVTSTASPLSIIEAMPL
jgi:O-methyltransferase domain/Dimerisation domain